MKRPRTTSFVAPPPTREPVAGPDEPPAPTWRGLAPIVAALVAVLDTMEVGPKSGPAQRAHRSAIRRQGEAAAAVGGTAAMEAALRQVADADPARAESRTRIVTEAWSGLQAWRP